jgi:hypothetical protein
MTRELLGHVAAVLASHGLILRGGLNLGPDEYPPFHAALLVGNAGAAHWPHFETWRASQPATLADPLDRWSRGILEGLAADCGASVLMPSDRPFAPFQQWAMRAEGLKPSPLGILMHPEYGLWHAFRGALLFDRPLELSPPGERAHPCDACPTKPCLHACPVSAHSPTGFDAGRCIGHASGPEGSACRTGGCLARNACPVGQAHRYPDHVQAFHMAAFLGR